jgi:hypothetical protein
MRRVPERQPHRPITGTALRFGVYLLPNLFGELPTGMKVSFRATSLDGSLRRIRRGLAVLTLTRHHGGRELAASTDGCLKVWRRGDRLIIRVEPYGNSGRAAIRSMKQWSFAHRELSTETRIREYDKVPGDPLSIVVTRADLIAVSTVHRGACPGCRLFVP